MNRRRFITGTILATAAGGIGSALADERPAGQAIAQTTVAGPDKTSPPRFSELRTITLEEHYIGPPFLASPGGQAYINPQFPARPGEQAMQVSSSHVNAQLQDLGAGRLALMDAAGIDVQVLSHSPGLEQLEASEQVPMVRDTNDFLKDIVAGHPTRFGGFASVSTMAPDQAAKELERMMQVGFKGAIINGHSHGRYLDDKFFWPILEAAEHLDAPIYLHPTQPPKAVLDAYYSGFSPQLSMLFSMAGCGWHIETGIHLTRMILGGVFDQFPNLKIFQGHLGEGLPYWLPRLDASLSQGLTKLKQPISAYLRQNVYYTFSGFNFLPNFIDLASQVGIEDRIMFSADHPYGSMSQARMFLDSLPISPSDRARIAHGNAERLLKM